MPDLITGLAAPLPLANVDTDVIMPKRFLRTISREGLADGTFADLRFDEAGRVRPDFVLNQKTWANASILVAGDNFGCGSSREHAVWGLKQLGIDAIIGTGFAGIFYDNARKNGLALPMVSVHERDRLLEEAASGRTITVDLRNRRISAETESFEFTMDEATRSALIDGRDDTLDTLTFAEKIRAFEARQTPRQRVVVKG